MYAAQSRRQGPRQVWVTTAAGFIPRCPTVPVGRGYRGTSPGAGRWACGTARALKLASSACKTRASRRGGGFHVVGHACPLLAPGIQPAMQVCLRKLKVSVSCGFGQAGRCRRRVGTVPGGPNSAGFLAAPAWSPGFERPGPQPWDKRGISAGSPRVTRQATNPPRDIC